MPLPDAIMPRLPWLIGSERDCHRFERFLQPVQCWKPPTLCPHCGQDVDRTPDLKPKGGAEWRLMGGVYVRE